MDIDIVNLLKSLRNSGLTQIQIADQAGCSQPTICEMEQGKTGIRRPSYRIVSSLVDLAKARGIVVPTLPSDEEAA